MEVKADYQQIVGQVKERNKLYRAILKIRELANQYQANNKNDLHHPKLTNKIISICDNATKDI